MKTKNKFLLNTLNILIFFILFNFINCSHKGSLHQFERIPKKDIIWIYGGNMQDDEVRILKVILKKLTREGFKYLDDQNFNERIQSRGLVIFGTPQNNLLIKKFASEQQICYSDTGLNFHNYFFKGPDHSIVMAYKDDQDRLIVLMISDRFENLLNLMWDDRYDFIVYDHIGPVLKGYITAGQIDKQRSIYTERPKWLKVESENFVLLHTKNVSPADVEYILKIDEAALKQIKDLLKIDLERKISHYIFPSNRAKAEITDKSGNAHCNLKYAEIYSVFSESVKAIGPHEIAHILANKIGSPPSLVGEGLAVYFDKRWLGQDLDYWVRRYNAEGRLMPLSSIIDIIDFKTANDSITYPVSGSFVKYLIDQYGIDKFKELYHLCDGYSEPDSIIKTFKKIFDKPFELLEREWREKVLAGS